jgi:hypothetical protein
MLLGDLPTAVNGRMGAARHSEASQLVGWGVRCDGLERRWCTATERRELDFCGQKCSLVLYIGGASIKMCVARSLGCIYFQSKLLRLNSLSVIIIQRGMNPNDFFDPIRLGALGGNPGRARAEPVHVGCDRVSIGGATAVHGATARYG